MIDITKQRQSETTSKAPQNAAPPVPKVNAAPAPVVQPAAAPPTPLVADAGYQQELANVHGPGGARDPFAEEDKPVYKQAEVAPIEGSPEASQAEIDAASGKNIVRYSQDFKPAEAAPIEGSPEESQAAIDRTQPNVERVSLTTDEQQHQADAAVAQAAATAASRRSALLAEAGLNDAMIQGRINAGKLSGHQYTEEQIIGAAIAAKHSYLGDLFSNFGSQFEAGKSQLGEAASGEGSHVLSPGQTGGLNGAERVAKAVQGTAVAGIGALFTPVSYATGEIAQTELMANPQIYSRFQKNMLAVGLDPNSQDAPNQRLEIVMQTLMESYLSGVDGEWQWAAPILASRGYLEALAGGETPGVVGLVKAPYNVTRAGIGLTRNLSRTLANEAKYQQALATITKSGGLAARTATPGSRLAAIAADDARMAELAQRVTLGQKARAIASGLGSFSSDERAGGLSVEVGKYGNDARVGKFVVGSTEGVTSAAGTRSGGFFDPRTGEIHIDPSAFAGGIAGKRQIVAATVHEFVHAGQWILQARRNEATWEKMTDLERLPSQVQEAVLRVMGVPREAMTDPNVSKAWNDMGFRNQIADALGKFMKSDDAKGFGEDKALPRTSLTHYADESQRGRQLRALNKLRQQRIKEFGPSSIASVEERQLADQIIAGPAQQARINASAYGNAPAEGAAPRALYPNEQKIVDRVKAGDDMRKIASDIGMSEGSVRQIARRNGALSQGDASKAPATATALSRPTTPEDHATEIHHLTITEGGATYSLTEGNLAGSDRWAVGAYPERSVTIEGQAAQSDIRSFIKDNAELLQRRDLSVGTWFDESRGVTVLDLVKTPGAEKFMSSRSGSPANDLKNAREAARQQAIQIAKEANQDAIYNLRTGKTVRTPREEAHPADVAAIRQRVHEHAIPELFTKARKWYTDASEFARSMSDEADFGASSTPFRNIAVAMAALSPQNSWTSTGKLDNMKAIFRIVRAYEHGYKEPPMDEPMNLDGKAIKKAWSALTSKGDPMDELVGPKERSFALNILGERDMATVDRQIRSGAPSVAAKKGTTALTPAEHDRIQAGYESSLKELKADGTIPSDWNVRDLQALDWGILSENDLHFYEPQDVFGATPVENRPYDVSPGTGDEPPSGFTVQAPGDALASIPEPTPFDKPYPKRDEFTVNGATNFDAYDRAQRVWSDERAVHGVPRLKVEGFDDAPYQVENHGTASEPQWVVIHTHTSDANFPRGYPLGYDGKSGKTYPTLNDAYMAARQMNIDKGITLRASAPRSGLAAPRSGLTSPVFAKYKSMGHMMALIEDAGFKGIADFSDAVKRGDFEALQGAPDQLIEDFAVGHIERATKGFGVDSNEITRIAKAYVAGLREGKTPAQIVTESLSGEKWNPGDPTAAAPSSGLADGGDTHGFKPGEKQGVGGISGVGTAASHGVTGDGLIDWRKPQPVMLREFLPSGKAEMVEQRVYEDLGNKTPKLLPNRSVEGGLEMDIKDAIVGFNDTLRQMMASGDDSFVLNQGLMSLFTHPTEGVRMFIDSLVSISSEKGLARVNEAVNSLPTHSIARQAGVKFDNLGDSEFFQAHWLEMLPGAAGQFFKVSDRGYTGAGNSIRGHLFDTLANGWFGFMDTLKNPDLEMGSPEYHKAIKQAMDLADYVNMITGVGDISMLPKWVQGTAPGFFAFKFMASKFNTITSPFQYTQQALRGALPSRLSFGEHGIPTPMYLTAEHASSFRMAALAWRDLSMYVGEMYVAAQIMKFLGVDVGLDPNQDSKFLQVTFGEGDDAQQWDMSGGLGKIASLIYQTAPFIGSGEHTTVQGMHYKFADKPFGQAKASELWIAFMKNKLGPAYSDAWQLIDRQNAKGQPVTAWDLTPLPITVKNAVELFFSEAWKNPANWLGTAIQGFGGHGFNRAPHANPPGILGTPINDLLGGGGDKGDEEVAPL